MNSIRSYVRRDDHEPDALRAHSIASRHFNDIRRPSRADGSDLGSVSLDPPRGAETVPQRSKLRVPARNSRDSAVALKSAAASSRTVLALFYTAALCVVSLLSGASIASACTIPTNLGVAFSVDDSGSMSTSDPSRLRSAATGAGIDQLPDGSFASVSSFDSSSRSLVDPVVVSAANRPSIKSQVEAGLNASGQTYYDLAFSKGKQQLDAMPGTDKRALVFLSDGAPNGGDYSDELDAIKQAGIPVFAIGFFSAPGSVLAEIAASTGGQAYTVQSPGEAQAVFARIVSTLTCDATQVQQSVALNPGETRGFPYTINPTDREFRALAAWSFEGVTVRLRRPDGSFLAPGAELAGERFTSEQTYASVIGRNPAIGDWELQITAAADNVDQVNVTIDIFRRTSADPPDAFALVAPAAAAEIPLGSATFSWVGARNAEGYELEINDRVVAKDLPREATSVTVNLLGSAGVNSWRVIAVNRFGRTPSERRQYVRTGYKYVALGDSFSSGEGVEKFFEPGNACHRSTKAYATFVERPVAPGRPRLSVFSTRGLPEIEWGFQACSGAETRNVTDFGHGGDPLSQLERDRAADTPQVNANDLPVDENTDLVTITIGGNDMKFVDVVTFCAASSSCTKRRYTEPCQPGAQRTLLAAYLRCKRDELSPKLDAIYARIHQNAPGARIIALGYPQLFPRTKDEQNCGKLNALFSNSEQNYLRQATSELNQLIAARAAASGFVEFVAVDSYFYGHEVCGDWGEWINAITLSITTGVNQQSLHPTDIGHKNGYAEAVNDALNPRPLPGLRLATAAPSVVRSNYNGVVTLSRSQVSCPAGTTRCLVATEARATLGRAGASAAAAKSSRVGGSRYSVLAKRRTAVRFQLTRKGLLALRHRKRLKAKVTVAVGRGNRLTTKTATVTIVAPTRRSK
jgi:hypothetical protein